MSGPYGKCEACGPTCIEKHPIDYDGERWLCAGHMCADGWPDCHPEGPDAFYRDFGAFHTLHPDARLFGGDLSTYDIATMGREEAEMRARWAR